MSLLPNSRRGDEPISGAMTRNGFRLDIQGIRGIAAIIVLGAHAQIPIFEGGFVGLCVFYVISGFLITGLIVNEIEARGTLSVSGFYARRVKRLLPAAVAVLGFTLVVAQFVFPTARAVETNGDVIAALLYFVNWRFIAQDVDYFAFDEGLASPVQHFWSLSVEEQFYIVWPLALLAVSIWAFRSGIGIRKSMLLFVAPVGIASLIYNLFYTPINPDAAYFSTLTRIWEIAAGAVLALVLPLGLRMPRIASTILVGGGILTVLLTTAIYKEIDPYPGWRAIIPVAGVCAVIVGATAVKVSAPVWFLAQRPFQYLGKISYSLYLWHWPFIVFAIAIFGNLSPFWLTIVTIVSVGPAILSHNLIEERFRYSRALARKPQQAIAVGLSLTAVVLVGAVGFQVTARSFDTPPQAAILGAQAIERADGTRVPAEMQTEIEAVRPNPLRAREDRGQAFDDDCLVNPPGTDVPDCAYGDAESDVTVALWGDSHALQYSPSLVRIAERNGWRLDTYMRAGCTVANVEFEEPCTEWRESSIERIIDSDPDMIVFTTGTTSRYRVTVDGEELERNESQPYLVEGMRETTVRLLEETDAELVLIRDQARAPFLVHECVADSPDDLTRCAFQPWRPEHRSFDFHGVRGLDVRVIDPMPILCPNDLCHPVIGDALVYRDTYHLSASFAKTLAPWLERRLPTGIPRPGRQDDEVEADTLTQVNPDRNSN